MEIRGRALKGGHQREQHYCKTGNCKREKQDRAVDFDFPRKPGRLRLEVQTSPEEFQPYDCQEHAGDAAEQREEKTFPEQLLHQPPAAGSQSRTNREFVLASRRAR